MVTQPDTLKTSNASLEPYKLQGRISYNGPLPKTTEVREGCIIATIELDVIKPQAVQYQWKTPPHVRLANLPSYDATRKMVMLPQSDLRVDANDVRSFVQDYGKLRGQVSVEDMRAYASPDLIQREEYLTPDQLIALSKIPMIYREKISEFTDAQATLRQAWAEHSVSIGEIIAGASEEFHLFPSHEGVVLKTHSLWNLICFMFMYDWRAGKIGVCACPSCVAPYFLKRRRTQKFCESGPCSAWASSQYTLKWWREKGKKRSKRKYGRKQK